MENREGNYYAIWFIKQDLMEEKNALLESMRDMSMSYRGDDPDFIIDWRDEFTARIEEINDILYKVNTKAYTAPSDDEV